MSDADLQEIWERGMSVYYEDHMAFARDVAAAEREACKECAVSALRYGGASQSTIDLMTVWINARATKELL